MIGRPSILDMKYSNMSISEAKLNYDRDVALYEQTEALKRIANQSNPISSQSDYTSAYDKFTFNVPIRFLDKSNPKYLVFNYKYRILESLENTFTPLLCIELFIAIIVTIITSIGEINSDLNIILKTIVLPISIVSMIFVRLKIRKLIYELQYIIDKEETETKNKDKNKKQR